MFSVSLSVCTNSENADKKKKKKICSLLPVSLSPIVSDTLWNTVVSQQRSEWQRQWQQWEWQLKGQEHSCAQYSCTIPSLANEALIKVSYVPQEGRFHMAQVIQKGNVSQKTPRAQQVSFYRGPPSPSLIDFNNWLRGGRMLSFTGLMGLFPCPSANTAALRAVCLDCL